MCGRFAFYSPSEAVTRIFGVEDPPELEARFNIAPTQFVPVVRETDEGRRGLSMLRWGLVPFWAKDKSIGNRMINARAETLASKPAYRDSFRRRRCIVPANGFYEWQKRGTVKQPYFVSFDGDEAFGMAGLWASWRSKEDPDERLETFTIVTTAPSSAIAPLHDRMPVILEPTAFGAWLARDNDDTQALQSLLKPCELPGLGYRPVSREVNNPRNDQPGLVEPQSV